MWSCLLVTVSSDLNHGLGFNICKVDILKLLFLLKSHSVKKENVKRK